MGKSWKEFGKYLEKFGKKLLEKSCKKKYAKSGNPVPGYRLLV